MSVQLAAEIWNLVRESVDYEQREDLVTNLVGIMIDHGCDLDDISYEFSIDEDVQKAVKYYRDEVEIEDNEYMEYDDEDSDEDY